MSKYLRYGDPITWDEAVELIHKGRGNKKKLANNLYLIMHNGYGTCYFTIRLYQTDIITLYQNGDMKIDDGGWDTLTTRKRIHEFTNAGIMRKKGKNICPNGKEFVNGMLLSETR